MGYFWDRWKERPPWIKIPVYIVFGAVAAVGFGLLFGMVVVWLWNWLMPMLFGLPEITFWQGVGLFILARLIFGGFNSHGEPSKSGKGDKPKRTWSFEYDSSDGPHRPMCHPGPMDHGPHPGPHPGPGHGPEHDFRGWRYYDEWWKSQGKESFDAYVDQMRPAPPPPPPEPPQEDA